LVVVVEVLELVEFVAVVLDEVVGELVVVVVVVLVVVVGVLVDDDELELLLEALEDFVQSLPASWLTVAAPWPRLRISVVLTPLGSEATSLLNAWAAL
jgi:hypothetical protein